MVWYSPEVKKYEEAPAHNGRHVALKTEFRTWEDKDKSYYHVEPTVSRWDYDNTNDGAVWAYDFEGAKDSSIPFGGGFHERELKTIKERKFKRTHDAQKIFVKLQWNGKFGTFYDGIFHNLGKGACSFNVSIPALPTYRIKYDLKGGSGNFPEQKKWHGEDLNIHNRVPTKTGYVFEGWGVPERGINYPYYTKPGGVNASDSNQTLTAYYKKRSYNVILDANGGTIGGSDRKSYSVLYQETIPFPKAERKNYKFIGWNKNSDGSGDFVNPNYKVTSNLTLYAIWELSANCYVKDNGTYKPAMMYVKTNGAYKTGVISVKQNGVYKSTTI